jgi:hypothetical protein
VAFTSEDQVRDVIRSFNGTNHASHKEQASVNIQASNLSYYILLREDPVS